MKIVSAIFCIIFAVLSLLSKNTIESLLLLIVAGQFLILINPFEKG